MPCLRRHSTGRDKEGSTSGLYHVQGVMLADGLLWRSLLRVRIAQWQEQHSTKFDEFESRIA